MSRQNNSKSWWLCFLAGLAPGCICIESPLFPPPCVPLVVESHACPGAMAGPMPMPAPMPAPQSATVRSVPLESPPPPEAGDLPPELPGIAVPPLTPGEPLPHAEPGPGMEGPVRPTLAPKNRPARRRLLVLAGSGVGA